MNKYFRLQRHFMAILFLAGIFQIFGQDKIKPAKDSLSRKYAYGLRVGADLSRPILSVADNDYRGVELTGDFRLKQNWWLAAELGNEERTQEQLAGAITLYNYSSAGSYLKLGLDHNTYDNWYGQRNQITVGGRLAFSSFSQTLNRFNYYETNRLYNPEGFAIGSTAPKEFNNLNATWLEFVLGFKAELLPNIYGGITARLGYLVSNKSDENFDNLWIPGFNRVTQDARWGLGYNYTLSYFIPIYKKKNNTSKKE